MAKVAKAPAKTLKTVKKTAKKISQKKIKKVSAPVKKAGTGQPASSERVLETSYKLNEGDQVPPFKIASTSGSDFQLKAQSGKITVLYFYPKDATPGCTKEGHDFTRLHPQFSKMGVEVYGISRDSLQSHKKFIEKQSYCFDFLSDEDEKVCRLFDVIQEKNMYGKKVVGIERSTFVIGKKAEVLKAWRKVKVEGHAQAVLDFVKSL